MFSGGKGEEGTINSFSFLSLTKRTSVRETKCWLHWVTHVLWQSRGHSRVFFIISQTEEKRSKEFWDWYAKSKSRKGRQECVHRFLFLQAILSCRKEAQINLGWNAIRSYASHIIIGRATFNWVRSHILRTRQILVYSSFL